MEELSAEKKTVKNNLYADEKSLSKHEFNSKLALQEFAKNVVLNGKMQNFAILGAKGSGKSSLIDSLCSALNTDVVKRTFSGGSDCQVTTGSGEDVEDGGNTRGYKAFLNCALTEYELEDLKQRIDWKHECWKTPQMRSRLQNIGIWKSFVSERVTTMGPMDLFYLPTLWDMAGISESEYSDGICEVLRRCLYGLVQDEQDLEDLLEAARSNGVEGVEEKLPLSSDVSGSRERRIDGLILVIDASNEETPDGLLKIVREATRPKKNMAYKRQIPTFVFYAKMDIIEKDNRKKEGFQKRKNKISKALMLEGVEAYHCAEIINYNDASAKRKEIGSGFQRDPKLDFQLLNALCLITTPQLAKVAEKETAKDVAGHRQSYEILQIMEQHKWAIFFFLACIVALCAICESITCLGFVWLILMGLTLSVSKDVKIALVAIGLLVIVTAIASQLSRDGYSCCYAGAIISNVWMLYNLCSLISCSDLRSFFGLIYEYVQ